MVLLLRCFCARRESSSSGDLNQGERSILTEDSPLEAVVAHAPEPRPSLGNSHFLCWARVYGAARLLWLCEFVRCRSRHGQIQRSQPVLPLAPCRPTGGAGATASRPPGPSAGAPRDLHLLLLLLRDRPLAEVCQSGLSASRRQLSVRWCRTQGQGAVFGICSIF